MACDDLATADGSAHNGGSAGGILAKAKAPVVEDYSTDTFIKYLTSLTAAPADVCLPVN